MNLLSAYAGTYRRLILFIPQYPKMTIPVMIAHSAVITVHTIAIWRGDPERSRTTLFRYVFLGHFVVVAVVGVVDEVDEVDELEELEVVALGGTKSREERKLRWTDL